MPLKINSRCHAKGILQLLVLGVIVAGISGCGSEKNPDQLRSAITVDDLKVLPEDERKAAESLRESAAIVSIEKGHVIMVRSNDGSFDDKGMIFLRSLPELQILTLTGNGITDEGLKSLHELKNLARIQLTGTRTSGAAIEALRRKLGRRCQIRVSKI